MAFLVSCHTQKHILSSPPVVINNTDSIITMYVETVRIDTVTVEIPIPQESDRREANDSTSHLETQFAESDAWINPDGTLGHSIKNKDEVFKAEVPVPVKDTEKSTSSLKNKETPLPCPEPVYIERDFTWWERFRLGSFWYLLTIAILETCWITRKYLVNVIRKCFC